MSLQPLFKRLYWMIVILLIALSFIAFNPDHAVPLLTGVVATNLQQILVLLGLGGLPGVLVWSSREVKKLKAASFTGDKLAQYRKVLYIRLAVFSVIGFYGLLVQYLTLMKGALMFMMVVFVLFAFVWPSKARFETEMGEDTATDEEGEQEEPEEKTE
jgi:uncharacterized membrane protein YhaH (DUF805 family)